MMEQLLCCNQLLKIVIICTTLVNIGAGYSAIYAMFVEITETLADIGETSSINDLNWIPLLIIQSCTTILQLIEIYCLVRELCEDNYMYKHCYKFCYVLTLVIYLLSVFPKSVASVINHNYDANWYKVWEIVSEFTDSVLSAIHALGFQIILFMPLIRKKIRAAGACRKKISSTDGDENTDKDVEAGESETRNDCCLTMCYKRETFQSDKLSFVGKAVDKRLELKAVADEAKAKLETKVNEVKDKGLELKATVEAATIDKLEAKVNVVKDKGSELKAAVEAKRDELEQKAMDVKDQCTKPVLDKIEEKKQELMDPKDAQIEKLESKVNKVSGTITGDGNKKKTEDGTGATGEGDKTEEGDEVEMKTGCCLILCRCLDNRQICFIVSMALTNIHFLVYVVQVVYLFCFFC